MRTMGCVDRFVIGRESSVLHVDFHRESDAPARDSQVRGPPAWAIGWSPAQHAPS